MATLIVTLLGDDRPGLIDELSGVIDAHGGSWGQSRMAHLANKFAGVVTVSVADARADALRQALSMLSDDTAALQLLVESAEEAAPAPARALRLELVGQDQPGIIHDIAHALASRGVGIDELRSDTESASHAGGTLFRAALRLQVPQTLADDELRAILEGIANELMVDVELG